MASHIVGPSIILFLVSACSTTTMTEATFDGHAGSSGSAGMPIALAGGGSSTLAGSTIATAAGAAEAGSTSLLTTSSAGRSGAMPRDTLEGGAAGQRTDGGANSGGSGGVNAGGSAGSGASAGSGVSNGGSTGGVAALGGSAGNQGQGCDGSLPFPSAATALLDDFNRSALGTNWTSNKLDATSQYQLVNGQLSTSSGLENALFWNSALGATEEVSATLMSYDENLYSTCLLLKSERHDLQGFVIAVCYAASFNGSRYLNVSVADGAWTIAASRTDVEVEFGDVLGARAYPNGCVEVFVNKQFVLASDLSRLGLSSTAYKKQTGYVGIANVLGGQAPVVSPTVWDDFAAGTMP